MAGGDHLLYIGTYAGTVQIFDEATEQKIGDIKLQTGIPRSLTLSQNRNKFYVLDSTLEKIEVVDIATRTSLCDLHAERRQQEDPHSRIAGRSARAVPDPADPLGHQADRSLGDRRHQPAALRPRPEEDHPHHPVAARRRARGRQHPFLARRQAALLLRRRRADSRDAEFHRGRHLGAEPAARVGHGPDQLRIGRRLQRRPRVLHRPVQHHGSGAEPPHHGHRPRQPRRQDRRLHADRAGRRRQLRHGPRSQARLRPDAADRPLRVLGLRRRAAQADRPHRVRPAARA